MADLAAALVHQAVLELLEQETHHLQAQARVTMVVLV
jgi:hypothetical protein